MKHNPSKIRFVNKNIFKEEIEQYDNFITYKQVKYNSLADMKRQIFSEISSYSDEKLDYMREYIKSRTIRLERATSSFLPIWAAIVIAMINALLNNLYSSIILSIVLVIILAYVYKISNDSIKELNFCSMYLELIEKVEEVRGHTFNDTLSEEYRQSLTMSEAAKEHSEDNLTEEI